jgi:hypothetical protein
VTFSYSIYVDGGVQPLHLPLQELRRAKQRVDSSFRRCTVNFPV